MWALLVVVGLGLLVMIGVWRGSVSHRTTALPAPLTPPPSAADLMRQGQAEAERMLPEMEARAAALLPEVEAEAARLLPEMEAERARNVAEVMRGIEAETLEDDEPEPRRVIWREDYVPKDDEARYLTRDDNGLPTLRLADAGDRLGIWSPLDGGALINPKGPGLRQRLGLCTSYARGWDHHRSAYRAADLTYGHWVDLKREPDNPHDPNAIAMCAPGSRVPFGYVGRGRARSVARRIDGGEDMAGVTIWGPDGGSDDRSTLVLIGSRADLAAMLDV